jgi:WD40 repeat protein
VRGLAFRPDGRQIASASADHSVRLWRIDTPEELQAWAKANRFVPELTCDKQQIYNLELACTQPGTQAGDS